jgi:hypothetical protein
MMGSGIALTWDSPDTTELLGQEMKTGGQEVPGSNPGSPTTCG